MTARSDPFGSSSVGHGLDQGDQGVDQGVVELVEAIDNARSVLRTIGDHALSDLGGGITTIQLRLLERLERLGESRLIDLADALSIAPSTATRLCDTLAERQLIVRHRRGRDRRELQIRLTGAGTQLLEAVRRRTVTEWAQALARVSEEDRRDVVRVLGKISPGVTDGSPAEPAHGLSA
ncbi:MAG: MarR family winged helix-turn-helix transcriptional regulator [Actinomycetota bacterium]|jgi:DNA-binding MarR family transcriptional regulator|nr:MarR family winged helix-turn-helix transcriptional regulator [Actinomycetota bacterium]